MKLVAHLVRSDVQQFRWLILGWVLLVIAAAVLTVSRPGFSNMRVYANASMMLGLLWSARQLAMLLIVPLVIQAHPAVGTDAFWMTRPIPPATLFASKLLFLATLLVVIPFAADVGLMLWIQVPLREALFVAMDSAIVRGAWTGVLIAGAAVTLNLPRFALLCGAAFLSAMLLISVLLMTSRVSEEGSAHATLIVGGSGQPVLPPDNDPTRGIVFLVGLATAGCALAGIQYRTRLRAASVPAGVGGVALLAFVLPYWPFPWLQVPAALPDWARDASRVRLHAPSAEIETFAVDRWMDGAPALRHGNTRVSVIGLDPGWLPQLELRGASVTLANGTTLTSRGRGYQSSPQIDALPDHPSRVVARQVLGVGEVLMPMPPPSRLDMATTLVLPADAIDPALPAQGAYRGEFAIRLTHWEVAATLPLRPAALFQDGAYRFAIEQVTTGPGGQMLLRAREWRATSSFDRTPAIAYTLYLRNAQHSHAIPGNESEPFGTMGAFSFGLPFTMSGGLERFYVRTAFVSFPTAYGLPDDRPSWDPAWSANAELVIVRTTDAGAVVRTLEMPQASIVSRRP